MSPVATPPTQRPPVANLLSGVLGGLVVLVVGAVLIATDVIDTGETTREVVRQAPINRPAADPGDRRGRTVSDIYAKEGSGVVFIEARGVRSQSPFGFPEQREGVASGSGFVIDKDGLIITNAHLVEGARDVEVRFEEEGDPVEANVKGRDPSTDIALLKVDPDDADLKPIPLGDSRQARVGDPVVAIGNPFGFTRTVTTGIVSALQRQITAPNGFQISNVVQTDASINPGNSGGPLLDANGRVIGINSQIATGGSAGSVGIGFAVPINTAKSLLPQLEKEGRIERAYLGIEMADVTKRIADDLNLPVDEGALIQRVVNGGPADDAGLRAGRTPTSEGIRAGGDLIVRVDGKKVSDSADVAEAIADDKPGEEIEIEYFRGDDRKTAKVELGKRPSSLQLDPGGSEGPGAPRSPERPDDDGGLFPFP
jgi:S1-C subfamily serine protease